ncbi:MAG TPA: response regulator transcription factor [Candidatus Acidoferrales bacterium]|jgi:DNA-binding NarL/FixJ family response regulator|nr:response regulator transcription factor [Candidatus Acidoferrales bacterium]
MHVLGGIVRIVVADDQAIVRKRVVATLMSRGDLEVCAEACNGKEAVEKARELNPDLVILDITMPELNGLDAARQIRSFAPNLPILILSVHKSKQVVEEAKKIGVRGYVTKGDAIQKLLLAVDTVLQDQTFFPTEF